MAARSHGGVMPRVALTQAAKDADRELRENKVLTKQMWLCSQSIKQIAADTGISDVTLYQYRKHPERVSEMSLERVRRVAHEIGMSKSDWCKLGGYE